MTVLDDFRQKYPQYKDIPDGKLAYAIRKKYYSDIPAEDFYRKAGLTHLVGISDGNPKVTDSVSDLSIGGIDTGIGLSANKTNLLAGSGKSFYDNARGLVQSGVGLAKLATLPAAIGADVVGTENPITDAIGSEYDKLKADQSEVNARDAALMNTKAGIAGNIIGQGVQAVAGGTALKAAGLGASVIPQTYGGAAVSGALQGGIQPISTEQGEGSRALNAAIGAGGGIAGKAIVGLAGAGLRGLRALVAPFTESGQNNIVAGTLGKFANGQLTPTPSAVPGVTASLAESTGNPGIGQLQRTMANVDNGFSSDLANQRVANNAARQALIGGLAGTPDDIAAAQAARSAQAGPLYAKAVNDTQVPVSPELQDLAQRPSMQKAVSMAKDLASEDGKSLDDPLTSTQGLHYVKLALDKIASFAGKPGFENVEKAAVTNTQGKLIDEIGKISPEYLQAKDAYKAASQPISQMKTLQELVKRGSGSTEDAAGNRTLFPSKFANAANQIDQVASSATGRKGSIASKILTPAQMDAVNTVSSDLSRQSVADNAGKALGSDTVKNMASQNFLAQTAKGLGLPGLADSPLLGRIVAPINAVYKLTGIPDQIKEKLGRALIDPTTVESQAILASIPKLMRPTIESQLGPIFGAVGQASALGISKEPALQR